MALANSVGQAPQRLAVAVDLTSVRRKVNKPNLHEFTYLVLNESEPAGAALVTHLRVDCDAMTLQSLFKSGFSDGVLAAQIDRLDNEKAVKLTTQAAIYPTARAICTGDRTATPLLNAAASDLHREVFQH